MKTEDEIQNVVNWVDGEKADDPCDDLPYIENIRAFKQALLWVLRPSAILTSAIRSDRQGDVAEEIWTNEDESAEIERQIIEDARR